MWKIANLKEQFVFQRNVKEVFTYRNDSEVYLEEKDMYTFVDPRSKQPVNVFGWILLNDDGPDWGVLFPDESIVIYFMLILRDCSW